MSQVLKQGSAAGKQAGPSPTVTTMPTITTQPQGTLTVNLTATLTTVEAQGILEFLKAAAVVMLLYYL